jgi:amino acid adenylation domain-containing protein
MIHSSFETRARLTPDALAVSSALGELTYGRLDGLTRDLAADIAERADDGLVGILADRGPHLVVAVLACAKAGRPFVVFDSQYPAARLATLIETCRPTLLLEAGSVSGDGLAVAEAFRIKVGLGGDDRDRAPMQSAVTPDDPAYLLFTSGSTGLPKCVAVPHRPLENFVAWQAKTFGLTARDRFTLLSGLSHDPVLRDIFTPLSLGASIHIPSQATLTAPGGLYDWFHEIQPTVAHMTPPLGRLLTAGRPTTHLESLRHVFWGGDVLRRAMVEALAALAPRCQSVNFYGATETPQAVAFFRAGSESDDRLPIGRAVEGFEIEVQDDAGAPAAEGEVGQIIIRSRLLTLGPVVDGRLPPPSDGALQTYATGDLGYRRGDGDIVVQGRQDDQVKVRGYRVELSEITTGALKLPYVGQAITLNIGSGEQPRLVCFVEARDPHLTLDPDAVRAQIMARLPDYMAPERVIGLTRLPLLPNGKIDRQALVAQARAPVDAPPAAAAPRTPLETTLLAAWADLFDGRPMSVDSSFAALGGDSLSYVTAYLALEEALGRVPDQWTTMSIAQLAATARPDAKRGIMATIESAILLRALAISAVVASHFQLIFSGGSASGALLWVSGYIFGTLQLKELEHQANLKPIGRLLKGLLAPLLLYEAMVGVARLALHGRVNLSSLLLYTDLIDTTGMPTDGPNAYGGHDMVMWYLHCVFHIIVIYALLFALFRYGLRSARPATMAAFTAVGLSLASRFLLPFLFVEDFGRGVLDPLSFFNHAPTTHMATFALAALAGFLAGRRRLVILAVTLVYVAASAVFYGVGDAIGIAPVAALLLFVPRVSLPRFLSWPIYMVAGSSLFIYLIHFKVLAVFNRLPPMPTLYVWIAALIAGVIAWSAWTWGSQRIARWSAWTLQRGRAAMSALRRSRPAKAVATP